MISVIIPALNEERTIGKVVQFVKKMQSVDEIIVVDDKSIDDTVQVAKDAGASVITSTKVGKGASMRDGFLVSKNEILVFLDGDIENYPPETIEKLTAPVIKDEADLVKATFEREAGRVTELVAKPLLSLLFTQINHFAQPLSGIIAVKRELFKKVTLEDNYGVDIGILLDAALLGARIMEINIGYIKHKMKQWQELSFMSREVARAILKRVTQSSMINLDSLETINIIRDQMALAIKEKLSCLKKMIIFDMDNTILNGRFIDKAAVTFGFKEELVNIITKNYESFLITKLIAGLFKGTKIARLFKGKNIAHLLNVVEDGPTSCGCGRRSGGIPASPMTARTRQNSYDCVANH